MLSFDIETYEEVVKRSKDESNVVEEISNLQKTGIIVSSFLKADEISAILEYLDNNNSIQEATTPLTIPCSFADFKDGFDKGQFTQYLKDSRRFSESLSAKLGFDLLDRLSSLFSKLSRGNSCTYAYADEYGHYLPITFRVIPPHKNHIDIHCGNQFFSQFNGFYDELSSRVTVRNQMSYFIQLHKPEKGGQLRVYDATWDEFPACNLNSQSLIKTDGVEVSVREGGTIAFEDISPNQGDIIIFQGGQYWHRVLENEGTRKRVTAGGFLAYSKEGKEIVYWS